MKKKSHSRSMQLQYCPYCGAMVSPDDLFCSKCGESLFGFDTFSAPGAPSGRRSKRKKTGTPWAVAAILAGVVACLVLVMLLMPRLADGGKQRPASSDALTSDERKPVETPATTETKKENRLMEFLK